MVILTIIISDEPILSRMLLPIPCAGPSVAKIALSGPQCRWYWYKDKDPPGYGSQGCGGECTKTLLLSRACAHREDATNQRNTWDVPFN